jgi:hypothetical protein
MKQWKGGDTRREETAALLPSYVSIYNVQVVISYLILITQALVVVNVSLYMLFRRLYLASSPKL